jgi:hypothetical protein
VRLVSTEGVKAEAAYAKDKTLPDPTSTDNPEFQIVLTIIKEVSAVQQAHSLQFWRSSSGTSSMCSSWVVTLTGKL